MSSDIDRQWMLQAVRLAEQGFYSTSPNPRVGCVLVAPDGEKVGEGFHKVAGSAHAEINALDVAGERARGATAYVTLEPCNHQGRTGACSEALINAGVATVVFGTEDPNPLVAGRGLQRLMEAGIAVRGPVLELECNNLNPGFIKRMVYNRPWVRCKVAASLDGRTAMSNGESKWITGEAARADVQHWRARSCAVITGVETVLADDPALNVRLAGEVRQPLRVVVDSFLRTPPQAKILLQRGKVAIATSALKRQGYAEAVSIWGLPSQAGRVDLSALLDKLAQEQCNEVLVESGPTLAGALLAQNLVDELIIYIAPKLLGSDARPMFQLPFASMNEALALEIVDSQCFGADWRLCAKISRETER